MFTQMITKVCQNHPIAKVVLLSYYVAKLIEGGTIEGWLNATKMHQAYYKDRGFDVEVVPSIQYLPSEENNGPGEEVFRLSSRNSSK